MFDHVTVRASDHDASRRFYEAVLESLGHRISVSGGHFHAWNDFGIAQARTDRPVTRRLPVLPRALGADLSEPYLTGSNLIRKRTVAGSGVKSQDVV